MGRHPYERTVRLYIVTGVPEDFDFVPKVSQKENRSQKKTEDSCAIQEVEEETDFTIV